MMMKSRTSQGTGVSEAASGRVDAMCDHLETRLDAMCDRLERQLRRAVWALGAALMISSAAVIVIFELLFGLPV